MIKHVHKVFADTKFVCSSAELVHKMCTMQICRFIQRSVTAGRQVYLLTANRALQRTSCVAEMPKWLPIQPVVCTHSPLLTLLQHLYTVPLLTKMRYKYKASEVFQYRIRNISLMMAEQGMIHVGNNIVNQ